MFDTPISLTAEMKEAIERDLRRRRRIEFGGNPDRHMVRTGQHKRPRAGTAPGSIRRQQARRA